MSPKISKPFSKCAATAALSLAVLSVTAQSAEAFQIFTNQNDYLNALSAAGVNRQVVDETFDNPISGNPVITFDSGVTSTQTDFPTTGPGNDNSVLGNGRYSGSVGRLGQRTVTWDFPSNLFPRGIRAFSFEIRGVTNTLAIRGFFDGLDQGEKTVLFEDDAGITNSGPNFFGLVGDSTFDSFTFFDSDIQNTNDFNFQIDDFTASVPTPAMLPGLIGMGLAALRKRRGEQAEPEAADV